MILLLAAALAAGPDLDAHNTRRRDQQIVAMTVLTTWSAANLGVGAVGWATTYDPEWRAFHQMSVAWSGINLAISIPGLLGAVREQPRGLDLQTTLRRSAGLRISFALNTGLDVGWVALGGWLAERGLRQHDARQIGLGRSMMLQGGFLLLFDAALFALRSHDDRQLLLTPWMDPATSTAGLSFTF